MAKLLIGTSGYIYKDWRTVFYPKGVPQKAWLNFYAHHYNAVEINATFYRPFPPHVFANWSAITPPEFRFVLKGPQTITHEKALIDIGEELRQFVSSAGSLGDKLSAMLWQFPASAKADHLRAPFAQFLPLLPREIKQVFEFRHESWFTDEIYGLLNRAGAGFVINDSPHFPRREVITDGVMYVRFHGPGKLYDSLYSREQMQAWAEKIRPRVGQMDVYLFFNNTTAGQALQNANHIKGML